MDYQKEMETLYAWDKKKWNLNNSSINSDSVCCRIENWLYTLNTNPEERQIWVHLQGLLSEHQPHSTDWKEKNQTAKHKKTQKNMKKWSHPQIKEDV